MANYRVRLSDATTTVTLYEDAANYFMVPKGLKMPAPPVRASYVANPFTDGMTLASAAYNNRVITLVAHLKGTTLADLKSRIRTVQRLLNDAEKRTLAGYGDQVYLEYQWGDVAGESTYFDVLRGDFQMVRDFSIRLLNDLFVVNAPITLVCKPFGRYANTAITQATLENYSYATDNAYNYMDIVTGEVHGDQPAKMYIKARLAGCAGTKKVWIGKRSGDRYADNLWFEGEDETSSVDGSTNSGCTFTDENLAAMSAGKYRKTNFNHAGGQVAPHVVAYHQYDMATPPRGQYRVLLYCRQDAEDPLDYDHMSWGIGWEYGNKTKVPSAVAGEYYECAANDVWQILDIGLLDIPPIAESGIAGNSTFSLRIYQSAIIDSLIGNEDYDWELDYVFLLPIDEGVVIIDDTVANATYAIDGITSPSNVYRITADKITDYPNYVGTPFTLGRETTRIYMLRDDDKGVTFITDITYQPQFLVI